MPVCALRRRRGCVSFRKVNKTASNYHPAKAEFFKKNVSLPRPGPGRPTRLMTPGLPQPEKWQPPATLLMWSGGCRYG